MRIVLMTLAISSLLGCDEKGASAPQSPAAERGAPPTAPAGGGSGGLRFEVPADFPIKAPAAATSVVYTDDTSKGQRQRTVVFQASGSRQPLIAHFEKELRASGLEPKVEDVDFGPRPVTNVAAEKGRLKVHIGIFEDKVGQLKVVIAWMERLE